MDEVEHNLTREEESLGSFNFDNIILFIISATRKGMFKVRLLKFNKKLIR